MLVTGWGDEIDSNTVEVYIHHLRRKLGTGLIRTVRGLGYLIEAQPAFVFRGKPRRENPSGWVVETMQAVLQSLVEVGGQAGQVRRDDGRVDGGEVGGCLCCWYPQGQRAGVEDRRGRFVEGQRDEDGVGADKGVPAKRRFPGLAAGLDPVREGGKGLLGCGHLGTPNL